MDVVIPDWDAVQAARQFLNGHFAATRLVMPEVTQAPQFGPPA